MKNKRDELLQVATQLAAGFNAGDDGTWDHTSFAGAAVLQAKDLIEKVDAEFGGFSQTESNDGCGKDD